MNENGSFVIETIVTQSPIPIGKTVQIIGACLICNEFKITHVGSQSYEFENACPKCQRDANAFLKHYPTRSNFVLEHVLSRTRDLFQKAKLPLICGLVDQPADVHIAAIELAQRINAVIDWTCDEVPAIIQNAKQETGDITCTYGELKERCDLVVLWGTEITAEHPAFIKRFVTGKPSVSVTSDRQSQLTALRFLRSRKSTQSNNPDHQSLKSAMDSARYPVILVDDHAIKRLREDGTLSLFQYVRSQNDINHCRLVHLTNSGNSHGIQSALTARAGGPFGITYQGGQPIYRGREFTTHRLLKRKAVDLLILVGSPQNLPTGSIPSGIKVIWLNNSFPGPQCSNVMIPTAKWGFNKSGVGLRPDGLAVTREAFMETEALDPTDVLEAMGH